MELIEARKGARYSQQDVADYLGISRPTYARMEANPETITLSDARRIVAFFDVKFNDIFFESDYNLTIADSNCTTANTLAREVTDSNCTTANTLARETPTPL